MNIKFTRCATSLGLVLAMATLTTISAISAEKTAAELATKPVGDDRGAEYAKPHQLIDVGGGRKLNLYCVGTGSPAVIFDAGLGNAGWDWLLVQPEIAKKTTACVYDRAGLGFSDAATRPSTSANAVDDLHQLLSNAAIDPPYVLVGHSYGGMNVRLYAYTYPKQVSGLVIVDGTHEDELIRGDKITGGKISEYEQAFNMYGAACAELSHTGFIGDPKQVEECQENPLPATFGPSLRGAMGKSRLQAKRWDATLSEMNHLWSVSATQLRTAHASFGNMPLVYLTRSINPYADQDQAPKPGDKAFEEDINKMHDEIAQLSNRGRNYLIPDTGPNIHLEQPKVVVDAIREVLSMQH